MSRLTDSLSKQEYRLLVFPDSRTSDGTFLVHLVILRSCRFWKGEQVITFNVSHSAGQALPAGYFHLTDHLLDEVAKDVREKFGIKIEV